MANAVKILICDDQRKIHETLKEYIEAEGLALSAGLPHGLIRASRCHISA